jgi:hypothetical protein
VHGVSGRCVAANVETDVKANFETVFFTIHVQGLKPGAFKLFVNWIQLVQLYLGGRARQVGEGVHVPRVHVVGEHGRRRRRPRRVIIIAAAAAVSLPRRFSSVKRYKLTHLKKQTL